MTGYRERRGSQRALPLVLDGRVPPHDLDAEAAVLSAVLLDPAALDKVLEFLRAEHFYSEAHRRIFEACVELHAVGQPVDVVQVGSWLKNRERIAQVGGMAYLTEVLNAAPAIANVAAYGRTIYDKARVRDMIAAAQKIAAQGYVDYGDTQAFLAAAAEAAHVIAHDTSGASACVRVLDAMKESIAKVNAAAARGDRVSGIATGFDRYDRMTAGLHEGDLTIVAGRPGMGKTSWVLGAAVNAARPRTRSSTADASERWEEPGRGVVVFSLEMPRDQIASRMICSEGKVDVAKLRSGCLSPSDWSKMTQASSLLGALPLWICDAAGITLAEIRARVRRLQAEHDRVLEDGTRKRIGVVVVDYVQLMKGREGASTREQEVSEISRGLKQLAKDLNVAVVALSQLNRAVELRADKRPLLSDLRESGSLEQDADNVTLLYRDDYYHADSREPNVAELIVAKQRNGPTGAVKVRFDKACTRFDNLPEGYRDDDQH